MSDSLEQPSALRSVPNETVATNFPLDSSLAAPAGSATFWCARFETMSNNFHPCFWKSKEPVDRSTIKALADDYLRKHSSWLKCVTEIYPPNSRLTN